MPAYRTPLRDLAPWFVLSLTGVLALTAHYTGASDSVFQLLSTIAGVCGGAIVARKPEASTTVTATAGDPPSITTGPAT